MHHFPGSMVPKRFQGTFDYLHIDGNARVHPAAQEVYNYGQKKKDPEKGEVDPYEGFTDEEKRDKTFEVFWTSIVNFVEIYLGKGTDGRRKVLDLTMDGPAPLGKQNQQRERRFLSGGPSEGLEEEINMSHRLSPGTPFSMELIKYLNFQIRKWLSGPWANRGIDIIFSPTQAPGEGEHKIMEFIRNLPREERNRRHLIIGEDGDLLFLGMGLLIPSVYLLREDANPRDRFIKKYEIGDKYSTASKTPKTFYFLVEISEIAKRLPEDLTSGGDFASATSGSARVTEAVDDFIFMGFFLGDDFLPMIQMFVGIDMGFVEMLQVLNKEKLHLIKDFRINFPHFKRFVRGLAADEPETLLKEEMKLRKEIMEEKKLAQENETEYDPKTSLARFKNHTLLKCISSNSHLDYQKYRKLYYDTKLGISTKKEIREVCLTYLKTMMWIFLYYTKGLVSWTWYYPHHYPPLMSDLSEFVDSLTEEEANEIHSFEKGEPSKPFVQLLSILPSWGANNLPKPYRHLMTSPTSPLVKEGYYPNPPFAIDLEGKRRDHLGIVDIAPISDISFLRETFESVAARDPNIYARNLLGSSTKFSTDLSKNSSTETYRYKSKYGTLRECKVSVKSFDLGSSENSVGDPEVSLQDFLNKATSGVGPLLKEKYQELFTAFYGKPQKAWIKFEDIPARLPYEQGKKFPKPDNHNGQRKLALGEIEFITRYLENEDDIIIYAGAAPNNKAAFVASLFSVENKPKWILIDPAPFNIFTPKKYGQTVKIQHSIEQDGPLVDSLDLESSKKRCLAVCRKMKLSKDSIQIINDFMTIELAEALATIFPGRKLFISDIRTNSSGEDEKEPDAIDILWNHSQMLNWLYYLEPDASMLKWRFPFYSESSAEFKKEATKGPRREDFEVSKEIGVDFVGDYDSKTINFYEGEIFLQAVPGMSSTESRLVILKEAITEGRIVSYGNVKDYEDKYFFYNNIGRYFVTHTNRHVDRELGFDKCNDCAIEAKIWEDYLARYDLEATTEGVLHLVRELNTATRRNLFIGGHGKLFSKPSPVWLMKLLK